MFFTPLRALGWLTASLSLLATAVAANTYCNTAAPASTVPTAPAPHAVVAEENPTVKPGLVNWHPTFADARAAAAKSGKPVLLFHMVGQLDKQFC
jgi:hypothetical protein